MTIIPAELNLARKLRPQTFRQIIGQPVLVGLLEKSVLQNKFFPVYLFSGQRGCGKTSTARIFAAALNCQQLANFQAGNEIGFPCTTCDSCVLTRQGNHPDFIEIDAASNTGVDNVRSILESCNYLPFVGRKKIYLIDEAHMLSKSAFNAFLKMLEDPPISVVFILATTEHSKIPDTVKSRCFQLVFNPLVAPEMKTYLQAICEQEKINIEPEALDIIIHEVDGCMRDALNLLEQVRFTAKDIDGTVILNLLGIARKDHLYELFRILIKQDASALLRHLEAMQFTKLAPQKVWAHIIFLLRALIWYKYGVESHAAFSNFEPAKIKELGDVCSLDWLQSASQWLWREEEFFLKTQQKHLFLEHVLFTWCIGSQNQTIERSKEQAVAKSVPKKVEEKVIQSQVVSLKTVSSKEKVIEQTSVGIEPIEALPSDSCDAFTQFVQGISTVGDRLLMSIITQSKFLGIDSEQGFLRLGVATVSSFYEDKLIDTKDSWLPHLESCFPGCSSIKLEPLASKGGKGSSFEQKTNPTTALAGSDKKLFGVQRGFDVSDTEKWPQANLLKSQFSGKLELIEEDN